MEQVRIAVAAATRDCAESDFARDLADTLGSLLSDRDRVALYAAIGAGIIYTAITTLLLSHSLLSHSRRGLQKS